MARETSRDTKSETVAEPGHPARGAESSRLKQARQSFLKV